VGAAAAAHLLAAVGAWDLRMGEGAASSVAATAGRGPPPSRPACALNPAHRSPSPLAQLAVAAGAAPCLPGMLVALGLAPDPAPPLLAAIYTCRRGANATAAYLALICGAPRPGPVQHCMRSSLRTSARSLAPLGQTARARATHPPSHFQAAPPPRGRSLQAPAPL
jgi:hypothetical protein